MSSTLGLQDLKLSQQITLDSNNELEKKDNLAKDKIIANIQFLVNSENKHFKAAAPQLSGDLPCATC